MFSLLAALCVVFLAVPLMGLLTQIPWDSVRSELGNRDVASALRLSLLTSLLATSLAAALGIPLAWVLARVQFRGKSFVRSLAILPMVMPPVVAGLALLLAFGRNGLIGKGLTKIGLTIPFTTTAVVIAEAFVAMPFLILAVEAALRSSQTIQTEEAAASLGASPSRRLRDITLPMSKAALAAGLVLCWARALGEFGATITFAGNLPAITRTMPIAVYVALERRPQSAIVLGSILLVVSFLVLFLLRDRWFRAQG